MSLSRYAPHQIRARYQRALNTLPIPAATAHTIDPERMTILGETTIAGRQIAFGTHTDAPRLWVTLNDTEPDLIGYMTGLITGEPDLWICNPKHQTWTLEDDNTLKLKQAATRVWFDCQRDCDG
ncbi:hypothetical protein L0U85_18570 [Glycomyces sp. L485]|nr:hypothetical protein [Glycomyces sp. L485]MCH7232841.1 hypothetical protein [Glycomyces sp. L485]